MRRSDRVLLHAITLRMVQILFRAGAANGVRERADAGGHLCSRNCFAGLKCLRAQPDELAIRARVRRSSTLSPGTEKTHAAACR